MLDEYQPCYAAGTWFMLGMQMGKTRGGETFVGKSLVALDTDHIKGYVFGTNKLKEIRGASSLIDTLNRKEMERLAHSVDPNAVQVYANGGSGLFLLDSDKADDFGKMVQGEYRRLELTRKDGVHKVEN
jgi:hypothetical protein